MSEKTENVQTTKISDHERGMARLRGRLSVLQSPEGFQLSVDVGILAARVRLAVLDATREDRVASKTADRLASAPPIGS